MRYILRPIGIGILLGAGFFFVPFLFRFILFFLFIAFLFRLISGRGWRRRGWYYHHRYYGDRHSSYDSEDIVPIDRQWYRAPINRKSPETRFRVD